MMIDIEVDVASRPHGRNVARDALPRWFPRWRGIRTERAYDQGSETHANREREPEAKRIDALPLLHLPSPPRGKIFFFKKNRAV